RVDGGEVGLVGNVFERESHTLWIDDDVLHRLQLGHVVAGLARHAQAAIICRLAFCAVLGNCPRDAVLAPVISSQREIPVVESRVQLLQVVKGGTRGREYVASAVVPPVLLQTVTPAGRGDELPDAGRVRA